MTISLGGATREAQIAGAKWPEQNGYSKLPFGFM